MVLTIAFQGDKSLYAQSPDPSTFFFVHAKGVACETDHNYGHLCSTGHSVEDETPVMMMMMMMTLVDQCR